MHADILIDRILDDEGMTNGLNDPEARLLIEWLVERAENIAHSASSESEGCRELEQVCRKAKGISRFVNLWCHQGNAEAAMQLAATERSSWPLPSPDARDPFEVLDEILKWEDQFVGVGVG